MKVWKPPGVVWLGTALGMAALVSWLAGSVGGALIEVSLNPTTIRSATPELLALGKRVYEKQCAACHGLDGRGEGEAAYLLYPKPRDFTAGKFEMVSTW